MVSNFKKQIDYLGLNYKKETMKIVVINIAVIILSITAYLLMKSMLVLLVALAAFIGTNYFLFSSYSAKKREMIKDHSEEFVHIISIFRIYISNRNNVYQSFNKLLDYSSDWMKDKIEVLLRMIDGDKSIKPFTDFADRFSLPIARNIMISIYQMVEEGESSTQLNQFVVLFEQMNSTLNEEKKERKIHSFDMVSFFPMLGAGIVTLSLTFSMLTLVGDMMNVV